MNRLNFKCDICGRFISLADIMSNRARHTMIAPDSDLSYETWEILCPEHNIPKNRTKYGSTLAILNL